MKDLIGEIHKKSEENGKKEEVEGQGKEMG